MIDQQSAARDLHAIRSLMERATIYRAISGPTALLGGILALGTALALGILGRTGSPATEAGFVAAWLSVLAIAATFNFVLIHRDAVRRNEPFVSPGMRLALRAIAPPMFVGGILGITLALRFDQPAFAAVTWILAYGLALHATAGFAPVSIKRLGAAFIASGTALLAAWLLLGDAGRVSPVILAAVFMGATFGLLHLLYGLCVVLPQTRARNHERLMA